MGVDNQEGGWACRAQVSALALCKLSKTEVLLRWLGKARRHEHEERLFWRLDEAPAEALQALQVSFTPSPFTTTCHPGYGPVPISEILSDRDWHAAH
jgi:hypothetical protein